MKLPKENIEEPTLATMEKILDKIPKAHTIKAKIDK
jgi:hypothetical protein